MPTKESIFEVALKNRHTKRAAGLLFFLAGFTSGCSAIPQVSVTNLPDISKIRLPKDELGRTVISPETLGPNATIAILGISTIVIGGLILVPLIHARGVDSKAAAEFKAQLAAEDEAKNAPKSNQMSPTDRAMNGFFDIVLFPVNHPLDFAKKILKL
jgi:hypothetical protein